MDQLQLLTYISEAVLDKSPRVVIYQVLKKKVCPPFSPRRNQTKPLPEIALNRSQPVQTCTVQLGEIGPSSPGKHPNRVLPVSLAEPRGKTQARARSPSLPGSLLHLATPRHVPGIPRDPSQLIFIKHPLSTPHRGVGHCRKRWLHAGKTKRTATGTENEFRREVGCLRPSVLERNPHPHSAVVTVPGKRWPRGVQQALLPRIRHRLGWKGKGKESASLDHPHAPLLQ